MCEIKIEYERETGHCSVSPYVKEITIKSIEKGINSDNLYVVSFEEMGWNAVTSLTTYEVGQKVMFIPPESVLPNELGDKLNITKYLSKGRVKVSSFRGNRSEGIIVNREIVEPYLPHIMKWEDLPTIGMVGEQISPSDVPYDFIRFYKMPNILNEPNTFKGGDDIWFSEKIHGCLEKNTKILLSDGTTKTIREIVENKLKVCVYGVDENGNIVSTPVKNWYINGKSEDWLKISYKRRGFGTVGNFYGTLTCTPQHGIFSKNVYKEAKKLKIGDKITLIKNIKNLTYIQKSVLIGKMLGDGSFTAPTNNTAHITFGHKKEHNGYLNYTINCLGDIAGNKQKDQISGYGTKMCRGRTIATNGIFKEFNNWFINNKKQIPKNIILNPITLAFWYMDDGSLGSHQTQEDRVLLATCGFNEDSIDNIINILKMSYDINAIKYKSGKYYRIRLNSDDSKKFFILIAPYIPKCMNYKIPKRYRCGNVYLSDAVCNYEKVLNEYEILDIKKIENFNNVCKNKYDIKTGTHNFFANEVLVHNSNGRCGWMIHPTTGNYEFYVGGHEVVFKLDDSTMPIYKQVVEKYKDVFPKGVEFFFEVYGRGIQDLHYDCTLPSFRIFAACTRGYYISIPKLIDICDDAGLPRVNFWNSTFESLEEIRTIADTPSEYTTKHMREGIVIVSGKHPEKMAKCLGFKYLDRKGKKTERH